MKTDARRDPVSKPCLMRRLSVDDRWRSIFVSSAPVWPRVIFSRSSQDIAAAKNEPALRATPFDMSASAGRELRVLRNNPGMTWYHFMNRRLNTLCGATKAASEKIPFGKNSSRIGAGMGKQGSRLPVFHVASSHERNRDFVCRPASVG